MKILICKFRYFPIKSPRRFSYLKLKVCSLLFSFSLVFVLLHSFWFSVWKEISGNKVNFISRAVPTRQGDDWIILWKTKTQCSVEVHVKGVLASSATLAVTENKGSDLSG